MRNVPGGSAAGIGTIRRKRMKKRVLAWLLIAMMVFQIVTPSFAVRAEESEPESLVETVAEPENASEERAESEKIPNVVAESENAVETIAENAAADDISRLGKAGVR